MTLPPAPVPSRHLPWTLCWVNAGPASQTEDNHQPNIKPVKSGLMLNQRRRRWANIKPHLVHSLAFARIDALIFQHCQLSYKNRYTREANLKCHKLCPLLVIMKYIGLCFKIQILRISQNMHHVQHIYHITHYSWIQIMLRLVHGQ